MAAFAHTVGARTYRFDSLKEVMAKASPARSGDFLAGVAALNDGERVAAQMTLADIPLAEVVRNIPDGVKYFMIVYDENVAVRYAAPPYLFANR